MSSGGNLLDLDLAEVERRRVVETKRSLEGEVDDSQAEVPLPEAPPEEGGRSGPFLLTGTSFLFTWNVGSPEDPHAEWLNFLALGCSIFCNHGGVAAK